MTVGAVILAGDGEPLAEAVGRPAVRRVVDAAWAGGAMPIVVVAADMEGVTTAVAGSPARVVGWPGSTRAGIAAGVAAAREAVVGTAAVLIWPLSMTWVDPETVTSLIEASGRYPERPLRPSYGSVPGWPTLLPLVTASSLQVAATSPSIDAIHAAIEKIEGAVTIEVGDPGTVSGIEIELDALAPFEGPPEPVGGPPPEWGAEAAETPD